MGTAPGWRREAITDGPGASHSFNIQANPEGPRPTLSLSETSPSGWLGFHSGTLGSPSITQKQHLQIKEGCLDMEEPAGSCLQKAKV